LYKFLLGAVGAIAMTASASAADLAARPYTKAPSPMIAAVYDWSGFYIGLNGGGGWSGKCWDIVTNILGAPVIPPVSEGCHTASGAVAGGQFGYRWQAGAWVFGVEAQGDWADLSGSNGPSLLVGGGGSNRSKIDAIALFTGQVGYAWDNVLLYVKGGVIGVSDKYEGFITATGFVFDRASETTRLRRDVQHRARRRLRARLHGLARQQLHLQQRHILAHRSHPSGHRHRHRARQLQIRRTRHREILTARDAH
jgi:outer membrane immunogenic protein